MKQPVFHEKQVAHLQTPETVDFSPSGSTNSCFIHSGTQGLTEKGKHRWCIAL